MSFESLLKSSKSRPPSPSARLGAINGFLNALQQNLNLSTWLLVGACLQSCVTIIVPSIYGLAPSALFLLTRLINTALITFSYKKNPYLEEVVMNKTTAQIPDGDGNFVDAGQQKVGILILGAKSNHPLGLFAPDFGKVNVYVEQMSRELEAGAEHNGFLGQTGYTSKDPRNVTQQLFISYWRSLEDIHNYAHGPLHREALRWWDSTIKQHGHIGFNHELYEADKGHWENLYVNFQLSGLGATTYLRRGEKLEGGVVSDEWISPLVDASRGNLRTGAGRLGRAVAAQG